MYGDDYTELAKSMNMSLIAFVQTVLRLHAHLENC